VVVALIDEELKGHWEYAGYKGGFTLKRVSLDARHYQRKRTFWGKTNGRNRSWAGKYDL
jgi:hypothetical protein